MRHLRWVSFLSLALAACSKDTHDGSVVGPDDASGGAGGTSDEGGPGSSSGGDSTGGPIIDLGDASLDHPPIDIDAACGQSLVEAAPKRVNVLVLVDRSGSMSATLDGATRWAGLSTALAAAVHDTDSAIDYGLDFFPAAGCDVKSDPALDVSVGHGADHADSVLAALDGAGPVPQGGTPTAAALGRAVAYFGDAAGRALEGERYVLLATDGGPNCNAAHAACPATTCVVNMEGSCPIPSSGNCCATDPSNCLDDGATVANIDALAGLGVHTFVVGIPGSEAFKASLDAFAVAGKEPRDGSTRYYAVTSTDELADTLRGITHSLVKTCELQLESVPPDPRKLNVRIDGELVPQDGPDGWTLDVTASPPVIQLRGATCAAVEAQGANQIRILYGCPTVAR